MPTYSYLCDTPDCGGTKTIICKVAERPAVVQCPKCGVVMEQDFSNQGRAFRGTGWTPRFGPINRG